VKLSVRAPQNLMSSGSCSQEQNKSCAIPEFYMSPYLKETYALMPDTRNHPSVKASSEVRGKDVYLLQSRS